MRIYSDLHELQRLQWRLSRLLESPPEPSQVEAAPGGGAYPETAHRPFLSRLPGLARGWRALVQRIPRWREISNLIWSLLTVQGQFYRLHVAVQGVSSDLEGLKRQFSKLEQRHARSELDPAFVQREIELLANRLEALREEFACGASTWLPPVGDSQARWYVEFENAHRGSQADIRERQRAYLPWVHRAVPDPARGQILDLGCGRGDWVAVLKEEGFQAQGVDSNAAMADAARLAGLRVHHADFFAYLRSLGDRTLDVVTAFQVVEHLSHGELMALFEEARRVLSPGGLVIFETPNPENLQVGAYSFWMDPTHVRPLPPPLLQQLAQHYGFIDIHIERINAWPQYRAETEAADPLHKLLYCGQDYALIANAPLLPTPSEAPSPHGHA